MAARQRFGAGYWPIYRAFLLVAGAGFADDANRRVHCTDARLHERPVAAGWDGRGRGSSARVALDACEEVQSNPRSVTVS